MAGKSLLKKRFGKVAARSAFLSLSIAFTANCSSASPERPESYERLLLEMNYEETAKKQAPEKGTEKQKLGIYMETLCFKPKDPQELRAHFQKTWTAFPELSSLTLFGRPLAENTAALDIHYCDLPLMPPGLGGQFLPEVEAVVLPKDPGDLLRPLTLAHEVMHAEQSRQGGLSYSYSWDIEARVQRGLAIEAAATTVEFIIAFEAKAAGNPKIWEHLQTAYGESIYTDKNIYEVIEKTYNREITGGTPKEHALRAAAGEAWKYLLEQSQWREFSIDTALRNYIADVASGALKEYEIKPGQFTQARIDSTGKIGEGESFTRGGVMPSLAKIVGPYQKIKWAFEAVDLKRHEQVLKEDNPLLLDMRRRAEQDGNPYLGVDLSEIQRKISKASLKSEAKYKYVHELMDETLVAVPTPLPALLPPVAMPLPESGAASPARFLPPETAAKSPPPRP